MDLVSALHLYRYRLFLHPIDEIKLPPFKGAALRGVIGHALREVACSIPDEECRACPFRGECAYAVLFESMPPENFPDAGKYQSFPRPYLINPPLSRQSHYSPGEDLIFEVVLVGRASAYLPHVILAFDAMGRAGFGGRGRYVVEKVEAVDVTGLSEVVYTDGQVLGLGHPIQLGPPVEAGGQRGTVGVHFLTPTRLEIQGKLQDRAPEFTHLMRMFLQRGALLAALYCCGSDPRQLFSAELLDQAKAVRLIDSDVEWREHERYSSRQQVRLKQGGIVGSAVYHGPLAPFIPYLRLMPYLNIGKSTTFGLGRVALTLG